MGYRIVDDTVCRMKFEIDDGMWDEIGICWRWPDRTYNFHEQLQILVANSDPLQVKKEKKTLDLSNRDKWYKLTSVSCSPIKPDMCRSMRTQKIKEIHQYVHGISCSAPLEIF